MNCAPPPPSDGDSPSKDIKLLPHRLWTDGCFSWMDQSNCQLLSYFLLVQSVLQSAACSVFTCSFHHVDEEVNAAAGELDRLAPKQHSGGSPVVFPSLV